ncbi:MAG: hypothetical protein GC203_16550 [Phenylobacterium sp.]|uniref:VOC family protein n=1 Tax=Phenylobacterium sp. TaxID=1871053 RepID=UPI0025E43733|nr:VOC family protein [Phenylobacterium sp.]MBI1199473.1 hypothetical protein [Phenylobacterium sp.]
MQLALRRIIVFTADLPRLAAFYEQVIGLRAIGHEPGWVEFDAGGCNLALHAGRPKIGARPPKLVFFAADVAVARTNLVTRGMKGLGPVTSTANFDMCDGADPDGNPIQISSRTT